jgi:hypothetical protein
VAWRGYSRWRDEWNEDKSGVMIPHYICRKPEAME